MSIFNKTKTIVLKTEKQKDAYASNFVKKYGEIDPSQSWDFTTQAPSYSLESSSRALTRDGDANVNADATTGEMIIEKVQESIIAQKNSERK